MVTQTVVLSVKELKPHPLNSYYFDDMEGQKWEEFLDSIRCRGVMNPPIVTQDYVIVSGAQRTRACIEIGIETIDCIVRTYDNEEDIIRDLLESNIRQRGNIPSSSTKMARIIGKLYEICGIKHGGAREIDALPCDERARVPLGPLVESEEMDQAELFYEEGTKGTMYPLTQSAFEGLKTREDIANALGISVTALKRYRLLEKITPEFAEMLESGKISAATASRVISQLSTEEQEQLFASLPEAQRYTQKQMQEYARTIRELEDSARTAQQEAADARQQAASAQKQQRTWMDAAGQYKIEKRQMKHQMEDSEEQHKVQVEELQAEISALRARKEPEPQPAQVVETIPDDYFKMREENKRLQLQLESLSHQLKSLSRQDVSFARAKHLLSTFNESIEILQYVNDFCVEVPDEELSQMEYKIKSIYETLDLLKAQIEEEQNRREGNDAN